MATKLSFRLAFGLHCLYVDYDYIERPTKKKWAEPKRCEPNRSQKPLDLDLIVFTGIYLWLFVYTVNDKSRKIASGSFFIHLTQRWQATIVNDVSTYFFLSHSRPLAFIVYCLTSCTSNFMRREKCMIFLLLNFYCHCVRVLSVAVDFRHLTTILQSAKTKSISFFWVAFFVVISSSFGSHFQSTRFSCSIFSSVDRCQRLFLNSIYRRVFFFIRCSSSLSILF